MFKIAMLATLVASILIPELAKGQEEQRAGGQEPQVILKTSMGDITIELFPDKAPKTVKNFLTYVQNKHYDNTIFHRVIPGFMIQGGGFTPDFKQKETQNPIENEADNGLLNIRGSVAMARTVGNVPRNAP